jgi:OOP family OmpA-OmpF porin
MKILIAGLIVLLAWGALSVHLYVCGIKGLCGDTALVQNDLLIKNFTVDPGTKANPEVPEKPLVPGALSIFFDFDKSEFKPDNMTDRYIVEVKTFLDQNVRSVINITGHTDSVGSDHYNQALGYRRAGSMSEYFISKGMPANKIIIESKGEKAPGDINTTPEGRANNRRAVTAIKN